MARIDDVERASDVDRNATRLRIDKRYRNLCRQLALERRPVKIEPTRNDLQVEPVRDEEFVDDEIVRNVQRLAVSDIDLRSG
jgi:hypothetical protein